MISHLKFVSLCLSFVLSLQLVSSLSAEEKVENTNRRFLYNSDADNMFIYQEPPMQPEHLNPYIDEIADAGVTTFLISPYYGMVMNFPSKHARMIGTGESEETIKIYEKEGREKTASIGRASLNARALVAAGHDPLGLAINRAKERGMEVLISVRLNEVHWVDHPDKYPYNMIISQFWREHPELWIGKPQDPISELHQEILGPDTSPIVAGWLPGGLDFAHKEVRDWRLTQIKEFLDRYDVDGIEIDFQRFPMFFKHEEAANHISTMTDFMRDVKKLNTEASKTRKHPILLSARMMAKPEQNKALGLDPINWAEEKLVDFLVASHYLRNDFNLPIEQYRKELPAGFPLYGSIEVEQKPERYRELANHIHSSGADGVYLFNYFTCRELGIEPDFKLAAELGNPKQDK